MYLQIKTSNCKLRCFKPTTYLTIPKEPVLAEEAATDCTGLRGDHLSVGVRNRKYGPRYCITCITNVTLSLVHARARVCA